MMAFFVLVYLLPIAWSLGVQDCAVLDFVWALRVVSGVGLGVAFFTMRFRRELQPRDCFLLVSLSLTLLSASGAILFMIAMPDLSFTNAYFESMSGLTT